MNSEQYGKAMSRHERLRSCCRARCLVKSSSTTGVLNSKVKRLNSSALLGLVLSSAVRLPNAEDRKGIAPSRRYSFPGSEDVVVVCMTSVCSNGMGVLSTIGTGTCCCLDIDSSLKRKLFVERWARPDFEVLREEILEVEDSLGVLRLFVLRLTAEVSMESSLFTSNNALLSIGLMYDM
jgi:hypothetical protein